MIESYEEYLNRIVAEAIFHGRDIVDEVINS